MAAAGRHLFRPHWHRNCSAVGACARPPPPSRRHRRLGSAASSK
jgi:hypothetical protein